MSSKVPNYGLHWDGSVAWLVQGRKGNNFVGMKAQCPFQVQARVCNHAVSTAAPVPDRVHWTNWMKVFYDPLVQAMLPIPRAMGTNVFYLEDASDDLGLYLTTLSRLSSPINPIIKPAWMVKANQFETELNATNIQPFVLVQADQKSQSIVDTIAKLALYVTRTIVIAGKPEVVVPAPIQRIQTKIRDFPLEELMTLPLENLGAVLIRRFARREELDASWEDRVTRRNRQISERS